MKACEERARGAVALAVMLLLAGGCGAPAEPRAMGEPIEMGPFVFSVEGTSEELWREDRVINVRLRLDREKTRPFKQHFGDFLFAEMRLVDRAGNTVEIGGFGPVSAGPLSAEEWEARFVLSEAASRVRKGGKLGDRVTDFSLEIENPGRSKGQAARVSIPLR